MPLHSRLTRRQLVVHHVVRTPFAAASPFRSFSSDALRSRRRRMSEFVEVAGALSVIQSIEVASRNHAFVLGDSVSIIDSVVLCISAPTLGAWVSNT